MKKWLLHIFLVSVLGMLTASCSQEADDPMQTNTGSGTIRIQFSLAMDKSRVSRADTWNHIIGNDETDANDVRKVGSIYENTINLDHFQVFLFQGDRYLGEVGGLSLVNASGTINKNKYTFRGEVTVNNATITNGSLANATIMVVANYEGYVNGNLAVTQNYLFDYIADNYRPNGNTANSYIPMWGILKPTDGIPLNESDDEDTFTSIGDIYMLRSLAKIEVVMGTGIDAGYKFTGATLAKYNEQSNLLPSVPSGSSYLAQTSTSVFNTEACKNPVSSSTVAPSGGLAFNIANDGKSCVIYVPEYSSSTADLQVNLQISKNGTPISNNLESKGTFTLNARDIVRNHWYQCTVNEINDGYKMNLTCTVMDWTLVEERWDFTDQVSHDNDLLFGTYDDSGAFISSEVKSEVVTYGEDLYCQFLLDTPTGATWQAEFISVSGDKNAFVFVNGTETSETISGEVGKWAKLVIRPANANITQNNSALLRISVKTIDGRTIVVKDLLPESLGNVKEYTITHSM